ncbi:MAG TPA: hypothetical protein VHB79_06085 [Polyangiaceae bacterium]|jgi:hypothetical protein|nr:hypothetical protein [Polyangiaceae bacterium]
MIGKLLIPVAIGGGLLLLMSSSAKAQSAPRNPFDILPQNLRVLAAQAQATNDPGLLEQTAAQLEMQGFPQAAGVLRMQADQVRRVRASTEPAAVAPAVAVPAPTTIAVPASSPPALQTPPFVPSSDATAPKQLTPDMQQLVADAIQNGTVPVLTSTAFVVEKAGFPQVAEDLRQRARAAAANAAPPAPKDLPNNALDPNMPSDLAQEVARQLQLQGDPAALELLAGELRKRGFNNTADQVEAKAKQIRAMLDAARTMHDIDQEFKTPNEVPPLPAGGGALPAPPVQTVPPVTVTATPPAPIVVPSVPVPQALPPERSKVQILADSVSSSLNALLDQYGSVPKARFKEDQGLVQRFQTEEHITSDGKYGPTTALHVARYASDVPPPFYWRKGAGQKDLSTYRSNLESIALDAEQLGNTDRAARLRASAAKASLA